MEKIIGDIAKNIKKYRKLNKMTQKDLAQKVGVSIAAVSNWETGSNSIDIDVLFKVCDALGVPISEMTSSNDNEDELSLLEKEIIKQYRAASPPDQILVLRLLKLDSGNDADYLVRYYESFLKFFSEKIKEKEI